MGQPTYNQFTLSNDIASFRLKTAIQFGASGAPTLMVFRPGVGGAAGAYEAAPPGGSTVIKSVTKLATGDYSIALQAGYGRYTGLVAAWLNAKASPPAAPLVRAVTDGTATSTVGGGTLEIVTEKLVSAAPTVGGLTAAAQVFSGTPTTFSLAGQGGAVAIPATGTVGYTPAGTNATSAVTGTLTAGAITQTPANPASGELLLLTLEFSNAPVVT